MEKRFISFKENFQSNLEMSRFTDGGSFIGSIKTMMQRLLSSMRALCRNTADVWRSSVLRRPSRPKLVSIFIACLLAVLFVLRKSLKRQVEQLATDIVNGVRTGALGGTQLLVVLASNILAILSACIVASLMVTALIGSGTMKRVQLQVTLLPAHALLWFALKMLARPWLTFCVTGYALLLLADALWTFLSETRLRSSYHRLMLNNSAAAFNTTRHAAGYFMPATRLLLAAAMVVYYFAWNARYLEPMTHRVSTDEWTPSPLCPAGPPKEPFSDVFGRYGKLHRRMLDPSTPDAERRFLVFNTSNDGLGNRLQGFLSTILLAILLDRAIILHWSASSQESFADFDELFDDPSGIDWQLKQPNIPSGVRNIVYSSPGRWIPYCRSCGIRFKDPATWNRLLCEADAGFDGKLPSHSVVSTQWYAPVLAHNPHFRDKICRWTGGQGMNVLFEMLWRAFIQPNATIRSRYDEVVRERFKDKRVIGMQIRHLEGNAVSEEMVEQFARCARQLSASTNAASSIFIATDDVRLRARLVTQMPELWWLTKETEMRRTSVSGIQSALLDMLLLGRCDEAIISPYSTFGYVAVSHAGKYAHSISRHHPYRCARAVSRAPCMQYWFGVTMLSCFDKRTMLTTDMVNQESCFNA